MLSTVAVPPGSVPLPPYDRYGLGLLEVETPAGRLVGNVGGIPGFMSIVLSTLNGRRQLGVMINVLAAPDPVYEAFTQVFRELGTRLVSKRRQIWTPRVHPQPNPGLRNLHAHTSCRDRSEP